jgi:hypothetical protein
VAAVAKPIAPPVQASLPAPEEATQEEPAVIPQHPPDAERVTLLNVSKKSGEKNGKPWTMYGIQVHMGDESDIWANTFDAGIGAVAESIDKGMHCMAVIKEGKPYNGRPSYNISYLAGV